MSWFAFWPAMQQFIKQCAWHRAILVSICQTTSCYFHPLIAGERVRSYRPIVNLVKKYIWPTYVCALAYEEPTACTSTCSIGTWSLVFLAIKLSLHCSLVVVEHWERRMNKVKIATNCCMHWHAYSINICSIFENLYSCKSQVFLIDCNYVNT